MKQKIFMLILCGLILSFIPSVSAEDDAEFLGRTLAEKPIAAFHPTDWVQQVEVLETMPEPEPEPEQGWDDDNSEDDGCGDDVDDCGEIEDVFGDCEQIFGEDDGECEDVQDSCGDVDEDCGPVYEDFCDDAKLIGTSSVIVAATLLINFVL